MFLDLADLWVTGLGTPEEPYRIPVWVEGQSYALIKWRGPGPAITTARATTEEDTIASLVAINTNPETELVSVVVKRPEDALPPL